MKKNENTWTQGREYNTSGSIAGNGEGQRREELEKVFEKEKRFQDAGWVGFSDMNNGKEGK